MTGLRTHWTSLKARLRQSRMPSRAFDEIYLEGSSPRKWLPSSPPLAFPGPFEPVEHELQSELELAGVCVTRLEHVLGCELVISLSVLRCDEVKVLARTRAAAIINFTEARTCACTSTS